MIRPRRDNWRSRRGRSLDILGGNEGLGGVLLIETSVQITPVMRAIRPQRLTPRVSQVLLLAGGVRSTGFRTQLGRHVLELPVDGRKNLLDLWEAEVEGVSKRFESNHVQVKVLVDGASPALMRRFVNGAPFSIERDMRGFRGTGGVLRDACGGANEGEYILVCNGFQILCEPLAEIAERLFDSGGALSFESEPGGVGGVFLMKAECVSAIPSVGFVDFKEQAIGLIAKSHRVRVVESARRSGLPVRSLPEYLKALRCFLGTGEAGFSVVEPGAVVGEQTRLHDSVVLNGGWIGSGAILAGSMVTAGGVVAKGGRVVHQIVSGVGMGGMA